MRTRLPIHPVGVEADLIIGWRPEIRAWILRAETPEDHARIRSLPWKWYDPIRRCTIVPELAWHDLASWGWPTLPAGIPSPCEYALQRAPEASPVDELRSRLPLGYLEPLAFQWAAIARLLEGGLLLGDDTGTGKTFESLLAYGILRREGHVAGLVVVCTLSKVLDWVEDFERALGRKPLVNELVCINYEKTFGRHSKKTGETILHPDAQAISNRMRCVRHVLVVDELHNLSNETSARWNGTNVLAGYAERVWGLTGTPMRNRPESFFPVYKLVTRASFDHNQALDRYCYLDARKRITGYRTNTIRDELRPLFDRIAIARLKSEVFPDMPPPRLIPCRVTMRGRQKTLYAEFLKTAKAALCDEKGRDFKVSAPQRLPFLTRLLQLASHPGLLGDSIPDADVAKFDLLDDIVSSAGDQKILVWDEHPMILEKVAARYPALNPICLHGSASSKQRASDVARFKTNPDCRMACLSLLAFGEGLNLQVASLAIFYGLTWRYEKLRQAMDRIYRYGQERLCTMYFLLAVGTLDEAVFHAVNEKHELARTLKGKEMSWEFDWNAGTSDRILRHLRGSK